MRINKISTPEDLINAAGNGFIREAETLANVTEANYFTDILLYFSDYSSYINNIQVDPNVRLLIKRGIIDLANPNEELIRVFSCAHLAAVCYLFSGCKLKQSEFKRSFLRQHAESYAKKLINKGEPGIRTLVHKIHNTDAIRTIQALKLFGLLSIQSDTCKQLSLGAGHGSRDLHSFHQIPEISSQFSGSIIARDPGEKCFTLGSKDVESSSVVLIDNDPNYEELYKDINSVKDNNVSAFNLDIDIALRQFQKRLETGSAKPRNLVSAFRIDHNMIPDAEQLLSQLYPIIDDECDFMLSIGAGYSTEEFAGRLEKVSEFFDVLRKLKLKPVRIKLHAGSTLVEKLSNPAFGMLNFATYELLYCKLIKKHLTPLHKHRS